MKFEILREELKKHFEAVNPILISSSGWHRSHYIIMEKMINTALAHSPLLTDERRRTHGSTISYMTLKRFFEHNYDENTITDLRFIKSIEKLCIYLGYPDYQTFFEVNDRKEGMPVDEDEQGFFVDYLKSYLKAQFKIFSDDVEDLEHQLAKYLIKGGPYYTRMIEARIWVKKLGMRLVTDNNLSCYELVSAKVLSADDEECICATKEYWHMVYDVADHSDRVTYNETNEQLYFFRKHNGNWKLWNNYNPDTTRYAKYFYDEQKRLEAIRKV